MNIIVISNKRKVISLTAANEEAEVALAELDGRIAEILEKDPEARPMFPLMELDSNRHYVFVQQWTYIEKTET